MPQNHLHNNIVKHMFFIVKKVDLETFFFFSEVGYGESNRHEELKCWSLNFTKSPTLKFILECQKFFFSIYLFYFS